MSFDCHSVACELPFLRLLCIYGINMSDESESCCTFAASEYNNCFVIVYYLLCSTDSIELN